MSPWVRLDDTFDDDPRVLVVGLKAFGLLVALVCWNNRVLADGRIPAAVVRQKTAGEDDGTALVERLLGAGLLQQDGGGDFQLHGDLVRLQPSREHAERIRQERVLAGRAGGLQSGKTRRRKQATNPEQLEAERQAGRLRKERWKERQRNATGTPVERDPERDTERMGNAVPHAHGTPGERRSADHPNGPHHSDPADDRSAGSNGQPNAKQVASALVEANANPVPSRPVPIPDLLK